MLGVLQPVEVDGPSTNTSDDDKRRAQYEDVMREIDVNKDGVIDYTEFITAAIDRVAMLNKQNLMHAFQLIDRDNSGMITIDEL